MQKFKYTAILLTITLSGCAPVGALYNPSMISPPKTGLSQIVIYYPNSINGIRGMSIQVGDKDCSLLANGFLTANVRPGKTLIKMGDDSIEIRAKAGNTQYIKVTQNRAKAEAAGAFGLVGLFAYNAANHGTKSDADLFFDIMDGSYARKDLEGLQQSPACN